MLTEFLILILLIAVGILYYRDCTSTTSMISNKNKVLNTIEEKCSGVLPGCKITISSSKSLPYISDDLLDEINDILKAKNMMVKYDSKRYSYIVYMFRSNDTYDNVIRNITLVNYNFKKVKLPYPKMVDFNSDILVHRLIKEYKIDLTYIQKDGDNMIYKWEGITCIY